MSRKERMNMMNFIEKMKGIELVDLMYMTDEDIEHIYETTYFNLCVAE